MSQQKEVVWQIESIKAHLLIEVGLSPSIVLELELSGSVWRKVGVEDAQRVEVGGVVASNLVGSDEELNL